MNQEEEILGNENDVDVAPGPDMNDPAGDHMGMVGADGQGMDEIGDMDGHGMDGMGDMDNGVNQIEREKPRRPRQLSPGVASSSLALQDISKQTTTKYSTRNDEHEKD